jgi:hypothetical protein
MRLGTLYQVRLRVETKPLTDFTDGLDEAISRTGHGVRLSAAPEADLESEADAFSIVRRTSARNIVQDKSHTEWTWDVRPRHCFPAQYRMNVRIVSDVQLNGTNIPFDAFRDSKIVTVACAPWYFLSSAAESESPKWFSALVVGFWMMAWTVIVRALKWVWRKLFRPKDAPSPAPDS